MTLETRLMDAWKEGYKEGYKEGEAEGRAVAALFVENVIRAFKEMPDISDEEIAKQFECDVETIADLRQAFNRCNNMEKRKGAGE